MNKLVLICLIIVFSWTSIFADISKNKINEYLNISKSGIILKDSQYQIVKFLYALYGIENNDETTTKFFINYLNRPDNINNYKNIFKVYTDEEYNFIMMFYKTKVGRKYADAHKYISGYKNQSEIKKEYYKLQQNYIFSHKKNELIKRINKAFNLSKVELDYAKEMAYTYNAKLAKDKQYSEKEMQKLSVIYKSKYIAYKNVIDRIMYYDFTEEELTKLLKYASTDIAKLETRLIHRALSTYNKYIMKNIRDKGVQ